MSIILIDGLNNIHSAWVISTLTLAVIERCVDICVLKLIFHYKIGASSALLIVEIDIIIVWCIILDDFQNCNDAMNVYFIYLK